MLSGYHKAVWGCVPVYLGVGRIGEYLYRCVPVVLEFRHPMFESGRYRHVETLGLAVRLRVTRCCHKDFDTKKGAYSCKEFVHELCFVIRKKEERNFVRYNPMIEEDVCNERRCDLRTLYIPSKVEVVIFNLDDVLASACSF